MPDAVSENLNALRQRCQTTANFGEVAAAEHEGLVSGIRFAAAELDKRICAVNGLLEIAASPTETEYFLELGSTRLQIMLETAIAKKGEAIVMICVQIRPWLALPTFQQIVDSLSRRGGLAGGYADLEETVKVLCRENPWLDQTHKGLCRIAGTAGSAEATGDLRDGPTVSLFCEVATLAVELLEGAARVVTGPLTLVQRAVWLPIYREDDYWDKPRTDAAMRARDRRYAGVDHFIGSSLYRPPGGCDLDTGITLGVLGGDKKAFWQTWEQSDERIYVHKRGVERDARLGPARPAVSAAPDFTTALSMEEVKQAYDSFAFANRTGRILNGKVTVSWFLLQNVSEAERWNCFKRFYRSLKQWFRDVGQAVVPDPADRQPWIVHVHENPDGDKFHTHLALVVPEAVRDLFRDRVRGMVLTAVGGHVWDGGIGALVEPEVRRADRNACVAQWEWFHYMVKGATRDKVLVETGPDGRRGLDDILKYRYENPGPIGRRGRVRVTQNLLPEARQAFADAGGGRFVSVWDEQVRSGRVDVRVLYSDHYLPQLDG